jgi:S-adenosylmethionine hydrolase
MDVNAAGPRHRHISLLTDYGLGDEFVGVVKAVLADLAPEARVLDLTHDIAPFDVRAGSLALARSISYLPSGVVMAVVDPGVGSERKAIAVEVAGGEGVLVGPDNGLLAPAVALAGGAERAVELTNPEYQLLAPGATFAGRDIFAPAAAHLCNGVPITELGPELDADLLVPATIPLPRQENGALVAEVLWVDRFGNCQLNVGPEELAELGSVGETDRAVATVQLTIPDPTQPGATIKRSATVVDHYGAIGGGPGLVTDSVGMLSICLDRRSAAAELGLDAGDQVILVAGGESAAASVSVSVNAPTIGPRDPAR